MLGLDAVKQVCWEETNRCLTALGERPDYLEKALADVRWAVAAAMLGLEA